MKTGRGRYHALIICAVIIALIISLSGCSTAIPVNAATLASSDLKTNVILTPYQAGMVIDGTITYSGKAYYTLGKGAAELVVSDNAEEKAVLEKAIPKIVQSIGKLDQTIPADARLVIYKDTLTMLVPLDQTALVSGEQRLELYQYFLASLLRAVEGAINDTANELDEAEKGMLQGFIPQLSITFYNDKADTLIFYPNGVFILNDIIIEMGNRVMIEEQLDQFFQ